MNTYEVQDSAGVIHTVEADYWENYDGYVDFRVRLRDSKIRTTHMFYRPISIEETYYGGVA